MKGRIPTAVILSAFLFTTTVYGNRGSCNQDSIFYTKQVSAAENKAALFTSGWESVSQWIKQKDENNLVYSYSRSTPQLNKSVMENGLVLVFARNLWADDPAYKNMGATDKPLKMPFYFLPDFDKPAYTEHWDFTTSENKINIELDVKDATETSAPNNKVQFRFIVIPNEVLQQKGQEADNVRKMSYNQIVQTFNLK